MLKVLKWLIIIFVGGFVALLAIGMVIEANMTPEERAAAEARRTAEKAERQTEKAAKEQEEAARAAELGKEQDSETGSDNRPSDSQSDDEASGTGRDGQSRVGSFIDKVKEIAADAEWQFTAKESPFDGPIHQATKTFESDEYAAEMSIELRCVQASKALSVIFESHVYDSAGNHLPSSAFVTPSDFEGELFSAMNMVKGRVKWGDRQPDSFGATLGQYNNVASLDINKLAEPAVADGATASAVFASLLPAYFELSNGAGAFTLVVPANNPSINRVLAACN